MQEWVAVLQPHDPRSTISARITFKRSNVLTCQRFLSEPVQEKEPDENQHGEQAGDQGDDAGGFGAEAG